MQTSVGVKVGDMYIEDLLRDPMYVRGRQLTWLKE